MIIRKKDYQKKLFLTMIRRHSSLSRSQIKDKAGIRLATITEITAELLDAGLVKEGKRLKADRGRQQVLLGINPSGGYSLGLEINPSRLCVSLLDLKGGVLLSREKALKKKNKFCLNELVEFSKSIIGQSGIDSSRIIGIGVALPGIVDAKNGIWISSTLMDDIKNVPLKAELENAFKVPAYLEERTHARLLGEKSLSGRKDNHILFVDLSSGIGAAVLNEGRLYRGSANSAVELGHIHIMENGPICKCGNRGCLEAVSSLEAIAKRASSALKDGVKSSILDQAGGNADDVNAEHVISAAANGDKLALGIIDDACKCLGTAVAHAVNMFNPELVIFGYESQHVIQPLIEPTWKVIRKYSLNTSFNSLRIETSCGKDFLGAVGAGMISIEHFFQMPQIQIT